MTAEPVLQRAWEHVLSTCHSPPPQRYRRSLSPSWGRAHHAWYLVGLFGQRVLPWSCMTVKLHYAGLSKLKDLQQPYGSIFDPEEVGLSQSLHLLMRIAMVAKSDAISLAQQ